MPLSRKNWIEMAVGVLLAGGCVSAPTEAEPRLSAPKLPTEAKTKVALMVGHGAVGACFNWMQLLSFCPQMELKFVDGKMIREGALADRDVLVCPGGYDFYIHDDFGKEGGEAIREFIRRGGGYFGTCAGAFVTLNDKHGYALAPWKQDPANNNFSHGHAQIAVEITKRGGELTGVKPAGRIVWYWNGPLMVPAPIEGTKTEILATYHGDILMDTKKLLPQAGYPAMVSVEFGKGRMVVSSCHPEMSPRTYDIVAGGFKYLTGRDHEFRLPKRVHRGLEVGLFTGQMYGVENAKTLMELVVAPGVNVQPISTWSIRDGALRNFDVVVFPDGDRKRTKNSMEPFARQFQEFLANGGKCLGWGAGVTAGASLDIEDVKGREGLFARLRELR